MARQTNLQFKISFLKDLIHYYQIAIVDIKNETDWYEYLKANHIFHGICWLMTEIPQFRKYSNSLIIDTYIDELTPSEFCWSGHWGPRPVHARSLREAIEALQLRVDIMTAALKVLEYEQNYLTKKLL